MRGASSEQHFKNAAFWNQMAARLYNAPKWHNRVFFSPLSTVWLDLMPNLRGLSSAAMLIGEIWVLSE